jgi:hypothetical protein
LPGGKLRKSFQHSAVSIQPSLRRGRIEQPVNGSLSRVEN